MIPTGSSDRRNDRAQLYEEQCPSLLKSVNGYEYPGIIVSVFTTRGGVVRYVVEADHPAFAGMLHIFNGDQLEPRT
jgi:hypothetical protein